MTGETVRVELDWFVRRDGSLLPVGYASAPMETPDGRGAVVVFRDLTERLQADEVAASRARIVAATDAERRRIGRDLHDGAQQRLVRALMGIEEARRAPERAEAALPAPPPMPATRSTTCASSRPASTRSCSPTAASARRSRS